MPFKAKAACRHHIPKQQHRVTNWAAYDAALRRCGSLTVWFTEAAIAAWRAEPRTTPGGQAHYSALAITTALTLRAVFRLALRQTEWLLEKHGTKARRSWKKLHLGRDADTGQIVAATLTTNGTDDGSQVGPLLDQVAGQIASFTGDGAYDQNGVYASVAERDPEAAVIVPPRSTAVPSQTAETAPTQRDRHLQLIVEKGRMGWQKGICCKFVRRVRIG